LFLNDDFKPFQNSQGAIDRFNVVADCCCDRKLGDLKRVLLRLETESYGISQDAIDRFNVLADCCCARKLVVLLRSETRSQRWCFLGKVAVAIGSFWFFYRLMVLIVDCVFIIASLIASSFFASFWKGCVIGGEHVSIMQGEEWNDDDANIKNSPC
jgi:hypothetical protein